MSAVPTGLWMKYCFANPTLKRGANNHCAYGAGDALRLRYARRATPTARAAGCYHCAYGAGDGQLPAWSASSQSI
jgi:hypothetical protein